MITHHGAVVKRMPPSAQGCGPAPYKHYLVENTTEKSMTKRRALAAAIVVVIIAGVFIIWGRARQTPSRLVPAWQLTPANRYRAMQLTDPFVSWAPDSRSLLISAYNNNPFKPLVLRWKVGEKQIRLVTEGVSPNYLDSDRRFVYLKPDPPRLFVFDLATGEEKQILQELTSRHPWSDAKGFVYDPERRVLTVRLTDYTQFFFPGSEEYSLDGRKLGAAATGLSSDTLAYSESRNGRFAAAVKYDRGSGRHALVVEDQDGRVKTREVASGYIGAIDWSPDEDVLAYGDISAVVVFRPVDGRKVVTGRFGPPRGKQDSRHVSRLKWSPNGDYLAVLVYVPNDAGDYPLVYILNMSKFKWE